MFVKIGFQGNMFLVKKGGVLTLNLATEGNNDFDASAYVLRVLPCCRRLPKHFRSNIFRNLFNARWNGDTTRVVYASKLLLKFY